MAGQIKHPKTQPISFWKQFQVRIPEVATGRGIDHTLLVVLKSMVQITLGIMFSANVN